jgi:glycine cleavage system H protein
MDFPDDLLYTEEHEWIRLDDDGTARVGITDFAQRELGDVVFVELDPVGTTVARDEPFGTIEAVKTVSDLFMPVNGTVTAHNEALEAHPELVNEDPYGEGWMVEISVEDTGALEELVSADEYRSMVQP